MNINYIATFALTPVEAIACLQAPDTVRKIIQGTKSLSENIEQIQKAREKIRHLTQELVTTLHNPYPKVPTHQGIEFLISKTELLQLLQFTPFQVHLSLALDAAHSIKSKTYHSNLAKQKVDLQEIIQLKHIELMLQGLMYYGDIPENLEQYSYNFDAEQDLIEISNLNLIPQ